VQTEHGGNSSIDGVDVDYISDHILKLLPRIKHHSLDAMGLVSSRGFLLSSVGFGPPHHIHLSVAGNTWAAWMRLWYPVPRRSVESYPAADKSPHNRQHDDLNALQLSAFTIIML
jgi:hypothetical protein